MELVETLESKEDASVNFTFRGDFPGQLESRFVRRQDNYIVCYLSAQTGCNKGCKMCHLTALGEVATEDAAVSQLTKQATAVLNYYSDNIKRKSPAEVVHFSFMARGEALCNKVVTEPREGLLRRLAVIAQVHDLLPRFMISTIMPTEIAGLDLRRAFPVIQPSIYYSIYSTKPEFRKRWLPKAMPVKDALAKLAEYQQHTGKLVKLHWALIAGENDTSDDVLSIADAVQTARLRVDVNIVRYNPFSEKHGVESKKVSFLTQLLKAALQESRVEVVDRVGPDVYASCGMFSPKQVT